jgi:hypothetical protein
VGTSYNRSRSYDSRRLSRRVAWAKAQHVGSVIDAQMGVMEAEVDRELGEGGGPYLRDDYAVNVFAEQCLELLREKFHITG